MVFVNGKTGKRIPLEKVMGLAKVFIDIHKKGERKNE